MLLAVSSVFGSSNCTNAQYKAGLRWLIDSRRQACDLGYGDFNRLRIDINLENNLFSCYEKHDGNAISENLD
jgi:hypothetical protein